MPSNWPSSNRLLYLQSAAVGTIQVSVNRVCQTLLPSLGSDIWIHEHCSSLVGGWGSNLGRESFGRVGVGGQI